MKKKIFVTGATGLIGTSLVKHLAGEGAYIKILSGNLKKAKEEFKNIYAIEFIDRAKYNHPSMLVSYMEGTDVIINLAGAGVGEKRWTDEYKDILYSSRIQTTKMIVDSIRLCRSKPHCLINISGTGYYGFRKDEVLHESSSAGVDFLAELCKDWEAEAMKAEKYNVRTVILRTGIVLSKSGGALEKLLQPYKFFVNTFQGSGKQWISWIHLEDLINMFELIIQNETIKGFMNAVSPGPVTNREFGKVISGFKKTFLTMPVPGFMLKIVAGKFAENLLNGQRVIPEKALAYGFKYRYPDLKSALKNLLED